MPIHYSVTKRSDGWVISADGVSLLLCSSRKMALRTIRDAVAQDVAIQESLPTAGATVGAAQQKVPHRIEQRRDSRSGVFPKQVALSSCS